ncbi:D-alanyl-D-alanine carboxypeptidase/D-alanyl-D-alanine endopeptidase [Mastigocoleus testarum]|uniref:D-alanyl-D-alanine carboxypeptidase n=1 Tax=Mastigocoleus testarum BC008 TaxID=371196 RepID=A0A0V7ZVK1_9CYAN|nr:D-alanyl-D-alanine carboxypeptidase/D-alanyl-D-alanine-endopeptidase [Mastigocoleus testarum]KST68223.1 D-alanyl-D-alanine carboxypeptidase [Mastigocoleus testarum BC008]
MSTKISINLLLLILSITLGFQPPAAIAQVESSATQKTSSRKICPAQLPSEINAVINKPLFNRTHWGILVQDLNLKAVSSKVSSPRTLYSRGAEKYFTPASVTKLLTTAAALQQLGKDYRIRTSIYDEGNGTLRVVGRGDPSLKDEQLVTLAKQLRQQGVTRINNLIADETHFKGEVIPGSWMWEDIPFYYGAPVSSFILNENAAILRLFPQKVGENLRPRWEQPSEGYRWRVRNNTVTVEEGEKKYITINRDIKGQTLNIQGQLAVNSQPDITAIAVFDPIEHFVRHFRQHLLLERISLGRTSTVTNDIKTGEIKGEEIAAVESAPLSELIKETNINSNNLFAEALVRTLAAKAPLKENQTTVNAGLEVLQTALTQIGVDPTTYKLDDGSGLSRKNLISPQALVQLLQGVARSPFAKVYFNSLPIAGKTGTFKYRLRDTAAEGIVIAKTGTMTGVVSLAGYVNAPNYEPVVFSIMVNQTEQPIRVVRQAIDEIVVNLAQLRRC